jgi:hypothetical protein
VVPDGPVSFLRELSDGHLQLLDLLIPTREDALATLSLDISAPADIVVDPFPQEFQTARDLPVVLVQIDFELLVAPKIFNEDFDVLFHQRVFFSQRLQLTGKVLLVLFQAVKVDF